MIDIKKNFYIVKIFFIISLFLLGCTAQNSEVPAAVKNLKRFKYVTVEHPNIKVPYFTLTDEKGNKFSSEDLKGKVYVIQGFAPGCSSCAREIAML